MGSGGLRDLVQRGRVACFANMGLKLIALVIAVVIYVLVHRPREEPPAEAPVTGCPPSP
jgi:hypothetical protein